MIMALFQITIEDLDLTGSIRTEMGDERRTYVDRHVRECFAPCRLGSQFACIISSSPFNKVWVHGREQGAGAPSTLLDITCDFSSLFFHIRYQEAQRS